MGRNSEILMEHNVQTCNDALELLEKHGKVAVVQPTGTGKSYIAMKIMSELSNCKKIVIAPSREYLDSMEQNDFWDRENTITFTYAYLGRNRNSIKDVLEKKIDISQIGLIVIDELHRAGAKQWGIAVGNLIDICINAKLLGLTAVPVRSTDKRNMVEELFSGYSVGNMSLCDTIETGVLPKLHYIKGVANANREVAKTLKKYAEHRYVLDKLSEDINGLIDNWKTENTFKNTLKKYLTPSGVEQGMESRHIVFVSKIQDIDNYKQSIYDWFSDIYAGYNIELYTAHSDRAKRDNSLSIVQFSDKLKENSIKIMITVQMLNESFHFESIRSITMFRYTEATSVFIQQIGRALSAKTKAPYIFDFVDNFDSVGDIAFLAGNDHTDKDKLGVIFESFNDETKACIVDINKLMNKIETRIAFYNHIMHKYANKYGSLYDIPEPKFRDWAIKQFAYLKSHSHKIVETYKEDFELTEFVMGYAGVSWLKKLRRYNSLSNNEKISFRNSTIDLDICKPIPVKVKSLVEEQINDNLDKYKTIEYMTNKIGETPLSKEAKKIKKLLKTFECDSPFEQYLCVQYCKEAYSVNNSYVFGLFNLERACAYQIWRALQLDHKYTSIISNVLSIEEDILYNAIKAFKSSKQISSNQEHFKILNTGILSRKFEDNTTMTLSMLKYFRIYDYTKLVTTIDSIYNYSYTMNNIKSKSILIIDGIIYDRYVKEALVESVAEFIKICNQTWLCSYFKEKSKEFKAEILPFVSVATSSNKYYKLDRAKLAVNQYKRKEVETGSFSKTLDKTKQERYRVGLILSNISKKYNLDGFDTIDYVKNYISIVTKYVNDKYDTNKKYSISRKEADKLLLVYRVHELAESGMPEYAPIYRLTKNKAFMEKLDTVAINTRIFKRIQKTMQYIQQGISFEDAANECKLSENISYEEEDAINIIANSSIKHSENILYIVLSELCSMTKTYRGEENIEIGVYA